MADGILLVALPLVAVTTIESNSTVAIVIATGWIASAFLAVSGGALVDRVGPSTSIRTSQALRTLAALALPLALGIGLSPTVCLVVAGIVMSGGEWLTDTAVEAAIGGESTASSYVSTFGRLRSLEQVANRLAGPAIGGLLFSIVDDGLLFVVAALFAFSFIVVPSGSPRAKRSDYEGPFWKSAPGVISNPWVKSSLLAGGGAAFGVGLTLGPYALFITQVLQLPDALYGILIAVGSLGGILGGLTASWWLTNTLDQRRVLLAWLGAGAAQTAFGVAPTVEFAAAGSFAFGVIATWVSVAVASARQRGATSENRGAIGGLGRAVRAVALAGGGFLSVPLISIFGLRSPWIAAGLVHLALLPVLAFGRIKWPAEEVTV